jgi:hypothetical protein
MSFTARLTSATFPSFASEQRPFLIEGQLLNGPSWDEIYQAVEKDLEDDTTTLFGQTFLNNGRKSCEYVTWEEPQTFVYTYGRTRHFGKPMPALVHKILNALHTIHTDHSFDWIHVTYYPNNNTKLAYHADNEKEICKNSNIFCVSFTNGFESRPVNIKPTPVKKSSRIQITQKNSTNSTKTNTNSTKTNYPPSQSQFIQSIQSIQPVKKKYKMSNTSNFFNMSNLSNLLKPDTNETNDKKTGKEEEPDNKNEADKKQEDNEKAENTENEDTETDEEVFLRSRNATNPPSTLHIPSTQKGNQKGKRRSRKTQMEKESEQSEKSENSCRICQNSLPRGRSVYCTEECSRKRSKRSSFPSSSPLPPAAVSVFCAVSPSKPQ